MDGIKPDLIKYEMRMVQGTNPHEKATKRPGAFSRFLSGVGRVFGAVAAPLSFIFPPAAIAAAGSYGLASMGDQGQQRAANKVAEENARNQATTVAFPGLSTGAASPLQPASAAGSTPADQEVMNVLFARGSLMTEQAHSLKDDNKWI